jgi:hypothetical protein
VNGIFANDFTNKVPALLARKSREPRYQATLRVDGWIQIARQRGDYDYRHPPFEPFIIDCGVDAFCERDLVLRLVSTTPPVHRAGRDAGTS